MRLTSHGHACLLVEMADARILIDPGTFSPGFEQLRDLDAILVTHQHPDHLDVERLPALLASNPNVPVWCDRETSDILRDRGIGATAHTGEPVAVNGVTITPKGELHALIHDDIPRIANIGVRLDAPGEPSFYHPGDAVDAEPGEVDVLAWTLSAPWAASRDTTGFLRRLNAPHAVPIHDALLSATGRKLYLTHATNLGGADTQIHDLAGGEPAEFTD